MAAVLDVDLDAFLAVLPYLQVGLGDGGGVAGPGLAIAGEGSATASGGAGVGIFEGLAVQTVKGDEGAVHDAS